MSGSDRPRLLRLRVDPVACDAYGFCAELLPERITLDEWGYPLVDGVPVDAALVALARQAVAACPRRALVLEPADTDQLHTDQLQTVPTGGSPPPVR
jgi:ferredoxin